MSLTTDQFQFYGLCVQTGAIVVSAIGVAASVVWNLKIARRRATLDILLQEQSSEHLVKERTEFNNIRDAGHLAQWLVPDKANTDKAGIVRATLNELVALGIRKRIVDRKVYRAWFRTTLVRDWIAFKPLVVQLRSIDNTPSYYKEFEAVAKSWAKGAERANT